MANETLLAIDPGTEKSALVSFLNGLPWKAEILPNAEAQCIIRNYDGPVVCEWIEAMGMAVGREVFETVYWVGRFSAVAKEFHRVTRRQVKLHLCGSMKAKDPNIRQALIDLYGGSKEKAIGKKASPGPLFGIASHEWSALAVGVTFQATQGAKA